MALDFGGVVDAPPVLFLLDGLFLHVEESIAGQLQPTLLAAAIVEHFAVGVRNGVFYKRV